MLRTVLCTFAMLIASAKAVGRSAAAHCLGAISGAMSTLWVAQEGGYFKRGGIGHGATLHRRRFAVDPVDAERRHAICLWPVGAGNECDLARCRTWC